MKNRHNLAVIYLTQYKLNDALKYWLNALEIETHIDYLYNLGVVYGYKGLYVDALTYLEKALELDDQHVHTLINIETIYLKRCMPVEAKIYYEKAYINPHDKQTQYMLSALENTQGNFSRSPSEYVTNLFDQYAATFEEHLDKMLHYTAPEVMYNLLVRHIDIETTSNLDIMDIGCGTGLMGMKLSTHARCLDGIDLSPNMLEKAKVKKTIPIYDGDIETLLAQNKIVYNLITVADVFPYYGDLTSIISCVLAYLKPKGHFIFTCESMAHGASLEYYLAENARYSHTKDYVLSIIQNNAGKLIAHHNKVTRQQAKEAIKCDIYIVQKV